MYKIDQKRIVLYTFRTHKKWTLTVCDLQQTIKQTR